MASRKGDSAAATPSTSRIARRRRWGIRCKAASAKASSPPRSVQELGKVKICYPPGATKTTGAPATKIAQAPMLRLGLVPPAAAGQGTRAP
jgi:hypothetical protein